MDNIEQQKKVREDVYKILKRLFYDVQIPEYVSITTENGQHKIVNYPFNIERISGYYKYFLNISVDVDYKLEDLQQYLYKRINDLLIRENINLSVIYIQGFKYYVGVVNELLNDSYFKGLDLEQILELAKKSIRITSDNQELRHGLENLLEKAELNSDWFYVNKIKEILGYINNDF